MEGICEMSFHQDEDDIADVHRLLPFFFWSDNERLWVFNTDLPGAIMSRDACLSFTTIITCLIPVKQRFPIPTT